MGGQHGDVDTKKRGSGIILNLFSFIYDKYA